MSYLPQPSLHNVIYKYSLCGPFKRQGRRGKVEGGCDYVTQVHKIKSKELDRGLGVKKINLHDVIFK